MGTHQGWDKKSSAQNTFAPAANFLESRPFAVQRNPEETTQPPQTQGYASQIPDFAILNPEGEQIPLQPKLAIGAPGDKYEQEADHMAKQVVQRINAPASGQLTQGQSLQLQEEQSEALQATRNTFVLQRSPLSSMFQRAAMPEEDLQARSILQRREAIGYGEASRDLESAINSARGGGQPLEAGLQQSMGQAMGANFSAVRVHTDAQSDTLNQSIQAKAFTTGQDIFFRQGAYEPGSLGGQELIAHELTHVVQQNGGAMQHSSLTPEQPLQNSTKVTSNESQMAHRAALLQESSIQSHPQYFVFSSPIVQREILFENTLENGWRNFLLENSQSDMTKLADSDDKITVKLNAKKNNDKAKNKLGRNGASIFTVEGKCVPVKHLGKEEHIGEEAIMDSIYIDVEIYSDPLVGNDKEGYEELPRTLTQQMVTVAHEWDLHIVPVLELYKEIREYQENKDNETEIDLGEQFGSVKTNELTKFNMQEKVKEILQGDDHNNMKNIVALHKTIINKIASLKAVIKLAEDPAKIKELVNELIDALEEQGTKYQWNPDEVIQGLTNTELEHLNPIS